MFYEKNRNRFVYVLRTPNLMKYYLSMKKLFIILSLAFVWSACDKKEGENQAGKPLVAQGDRYYGGTFNLNEPEYIKNLFPHNIIDVYSYRVASQVYEGLFKYEQDSLNVVPCLVESYTVDNSRTLYTFKLKKGVFFHDDEAFEGGKGRELKAQDIKYCFTRLCTEYVNNQGFHVFDSLLVGANEYYAETKSGKTPSKEIEGLKVIDDYTLELRLIKPHSMFIHKLARPETFIYPKEVFDKYGMEMRIKAVGTGPFKMRSVNEGISIILERNENYHRTDKFGNKLPFLDAIRIQFIQDKQIELLEFKQRKLDMMYRLPSDKIFEMLEETTEDPDGAQSKYILQRTPETQTQILSFLNQGSVFENINVRKAISYAIDREKILNYVLHKEGFKAGIHGLTPPSFRDYDVEQIKGYTLKPDSARYYMNKAGYPNGKGFPTIALDLNPEGNRNTSVANELKKQLKDQLNINLELNTIPHAHITEKCRTGNYNLIRLSWIADFPSPEAFMWMFHSKYVPDGLGKSSYPNVSRYKNPRFDEYYEKALKAPSKEEAYQNFLKAEQIMMADAPILVLWYDEAYRLLHPHVKNFPNNPMQYRDFSEVYFKQAEDTGEGTETGVENEEKQ